MNFQRACVGAWATAVAVSVLAVPSTSFGQAVQWKVSDGGNGRWYGVRELTTDCWDQSRAAAIALGGDLTSITSAAESQFVFQRVSGLPGYPNVSIGGYKDLAAGQWKWVSGEPWGYTNWQVGEPGCCAPSEWWLDMNKASGKWRDRAQCIPSTPTPGVMVVEWSADCNSDGIVDYGQCRNGTLPDYNLNNIPDCCEAGVPCVVGNYPVQWRVEDGGNGHWYQVRTETTGITWLFARSRAQTFGGDLASLAAVGEDAFVRTLLGSGMCGGPTLQAGPYLGGYQDRQATDYAEPSGGWRWTDGSPFPGAVAFSPDNFGGFQDYMYYISAAGCSAPYGLDDTALQTQHRSFIVEWSADCNVDGVVDYGQILSGLLVDADNNGIPDVCEIDPCPGDVNSSGVVNGTDIAIILGAWGTSGGKFPRSDANGDGVVDAADLTIVLGGWGPCP